MDVLGGLVARDRRSETIALRRAARAGSYSYEKLCTNCWKAGNLLRHYGVRSGMDVTVAVPTSGPVPQVATGLFGTALLGASAVVASADAVLDGQRVESTALLAPGDVAGRVATAAGCSVLGYGDAPTQATVAHYDRELWSENPTEPPGDADPDATALVADGDAYTHRELLDWTRDVRQQRGYDADTTIDAGAWTTPASLVETLLAPLSAGATVRLEVGGDG